MKFYSVNKPKVCPRCGSKKVVKIVYGMATYEAHLEAEAGKYILGGCDVSEYGIDAKWQCLSCKVKVFKKKAKRNQSSVSRTM